MSHSHTIRMLCCGFLLSAALLATGRTHDSSPQKAKAGSVSASAKDKIDVCKLLSSGEVEAVQVERIIETKASTQACGRTLMSQCAFHTTTFVKSLDIALD